MRTTTGRQFAAAQPFFVSVFGRSTKTYEWVDSMTRRIIDFCSTYIGPQGSLWSERNLAVLPGSRSKRSVDPTSHISSRAMCTTTFLVLSACVNIACSRSEELVAKSRDLLLDLATICAGECQM